METEEIKPGGCNEPPKQIQLPNMGAGHGEMLKAKPCCYPGCSTYYMGTGFSKYCPEHRKREYHKPSKTIKCDDTNIVYNHNNSDPVDVDFKCGCPGCDGIYKIKILPGVFVYPGYCDEHRNEWKRKLFIQKKG